MHSRQRLTEERNCFMAEEMGVTSPLLADSRRHTAGAGSFSRTHTQLICNFLISSRNHVAELMLLGKLKSERSICYVYRVLHWQSGILDARERAYARARAGAPHSWVPQIFPLFFPQKSACIRNCGGEGTEKLEGGQSVNRTSSDLHLYPLIIGNTCRGMHL